MNTKKTLSVLLALALILAAGLAAPLMTRFATRSVLAGAMATFAAGLAWLSRADASGRFVVDVLGPSLLIGVGLGVAFVAITSLAVAGVPESDNGVAGGLVNTSQQVGGAIGLAALAALATSRTGHAAAHGQATITALTDGYAAAFLGAGAIALVAAALTLAVVRSGDR